MVDLVLSTMMSLMLFLYLQSVFDLDSIEAAQIRERKEFFKKHFNSVFRVELQRGSVQIHDSKDEMTTLRVTFSDGVLFEDAKSELNHAGQLLLTRFAQTLVEGAEAGFSRIQVEGHTDDRSLRYPRPDLADNWDLGAARATEVVRLLRAFPGLRVELISANSYADQVPIRSKNLDQTRSKSRRVEVRLFFKAAEIQWINQPEVDYQPDHREIRQ